VFHAVDHARTADVIVVVQTGDGASLATSAHAQVGAEQLEATSYAVREQSAKEGC
jgi:ethanolamine ammonia-lyase large subunit